MKLRELKSWLIDLPPEFDEFDIVSCKIGQSSYPDSHVNGNGTGDEDDSYWWRLDMPIISLFADEESKEICLEVKNDKE